MKMQCVTCEQEKCTCPSGTYAPGAGISSQFASLLNDLDAMQTAVPYAARWSVLREAESVIVRLESDNHALAQRLREVEQERDSLNQVLRDAGWGQGEIDSAASVDDHVDTLKQRIAELEAQVASRQKEDL